MRIMPAVILVTLLILTLCCYSSLRAQELFDETVITVEGQVQNAEVKDEKKAKSPAAKDLVKFRQRLNRTEFQAPPPEGKKSFTLTVVARSYCLRGFTSRGAATAMGVVAVDPRVIPFGSKILVPGYGWATALDTGGAIKGNSIDIWFPTYSQCMQWGVRNVTITVVKP